MVEDYFIKSVIFSIDEILFGIPLEKIKRLGKVGKIKPVEKGPSWINGFILYRGNFLPYITLWNLLKISPPLKEIFLIPYNFEYCAFGISEIIGIYSLEIKKTDIEIFDLPYLLGFGEFQSKVVLFIELGKFLSKEQKKILRDLNKNNER